MQSVVFSQASGFRCRAFLFLKHLQLFIIFQPKTGKWRENSRRTLYSLEQQNRNMFSFCVSVCFCWPSSAHTHRSLFSFCFFNTSNSLVQYSLCPISPAVTQHHLGSASYSSKNLFFEKSSASPRSPFVRSLARSRTFTSSGRLSFQGERPITGEGWQINLVGALLQCG